MLFTYLEGLWIMSYWRPRREVRFINILFTFTRNILLRQLELLSAFKVTL